MVKKSNVQSKGYLLLEPHAKERTVRTHEEHLKFLAGKYTRVCYGSRNPTTLIVGSSMIERFVRVPVTPYYDPAGAHHFDKFVEKNVMLAGVGGDGMAETLYRIQNGLIEACPNITKFIIMIGVNDVEKYTVNELYAGWMNLITEIRSRLKNTELIVLGSTPRWDNKFSKNYAGKIKGYNEKLQEYCTLNNIKFVNSYSAYEEDNAGARELYVDHVHFNAKGYDTFYEYLEPLL